MNAIETTTSSQTTAATARKAEELSRRTSELTALENERHQLEGEVLERACKAAAPLIEHLGQHPQRTRDDLWPDRSCAETETTAFDWAAVHLAGDEEAYELHPRGNRGDYAGEGLWLDAEGQLRLLTYAGSWSRWQGEEGYWKATAATTAPDEAVEQWELDELLTALANLEKRAETRLPAMRKHTLTRIARLRQALDDGSHDAIEITLGALAEEYGVPLTDELEHHTDALVEVYHDDDGWHVAARELSRRTSELPGLRDEQWAPQDDDAAARVRIAALAAAPEVTS